MRDKKDSVMRVIGKRHTPGEDGERENYLAPQDHRVVVRLTGPAPGDAACNWSFDDGTIPPQQAKTPCAEEVRVRLRYGKPTIAAVGITHANGSIDNATIEIQVRDLLIAGLGDSVAAGEGNPDKPIALADDGFCFRRFVSLFSFDEFHMERTGR